MNLDKIKPKKSLGQNFLLDKNIAKKIVDSLKINSDDFVIEIGPGTGSLTDFLADTNCNLFLIEIDKRATDLLESKFRNNKNIKIIHNDFNNINLLDLSRDFVILSSKKPNLNNKIFDYEIQKRIKIIGNIPYYLTSEILFKLFDCAEILHSSVLTIQKEVAERVVASPNNKSYGILTIAAEISGNAQILFDVPPHCFFPPPKVNSSVLLLNFQRKFTKFEFDEIMFLVRTAFNQRRKMLKNSIKEYISLKTKLDLQNFETICSDFVKDLLTKRPEELSYLDFKCLYEEINQFKRL